VSCVGTWRTDVTKSHYVTLITATPKSKDHSRVALALADFRLYLIDHKTGHSIEEFPKDLLGLSRQLSFPKSTIHQAHPSVADFLIYGKRRMSRAEARMASLFDVSLRPPKPTDQEVSEALLST